METKQIDARLAELRARKRDLDEAIRAVVRLAALRSPKVIESRHARSLPGLSHPMISGHPDLFLIRIEQRRLILQVRPHGHAQRNVHRVA